MMGVEYEEIRVKIRNKVTSEIIDLANKREYVSVINGGAGLFKKTDFEIISHEVVYG